MFSTRVLTFATDNSGLLVYSLASAIEEQPCANRIESMKGIPSTQQEASPAIMASPAPVTLTTWVLLVATSRYHRLFHCNRPHHRPYSAPDDSGHARGTVATFATSSRPESAMPLRVSASRRLGLSVWIWAKRSRIFTHFHADTGSANTGTFPTLSSNRASVCSLMLQSATMTLAPDEIEMLSQKRRRNMFGNAHIIDCHQHFTGIIEKR